MRINKQLAVGIGLIGLAGLLVGCTEVVVPGTMAGGGEYYRYTTANVAKATLMGDVRQVTTATRSALKRMDIRHSKVFVKNNCSHPIYVAVRYLTAKSEPEHWQIRGWFKLASGQEKHIVDTSNRYIYFYAETRLQDKFYWGGKDFHWFEGERFGFFKADIGNYSRDVTQSFACD